MPAGGESEARAFYEGVLGIPEVRKPPNLAKRGGCWFERGELKIHLGVEAGFRAARKAHPALLVEDLPGLKGALEAAGFTPRSDEPLPGYERTYVEDPFRESDRAARAADAEIRWGPSITTTARLPVQQ